MNRPLAASSPGNIQALYLLTSGDAIKCYSCENEESNTMCNTDTNLQECDTGFDTCQTTVSLSGKELMTFFSHISTTI